MESSPPDLDPPPAPQRSRTLDRERLTHSADPSGRLRERVRELETFAAYTAHELRNPLQGLMLAADGLLSDVVGGRTSGDELVSRLSDIGDETRRLNTRINELMAILAEGDRPLTLVPVDIGSVVRSVLADRRHRLDEVGAEVIVAPDLPTVTTELASVTTVLSNLVANAIRFRCPGRPLRVVIDSEHLGDRWRFSVGDNGRGIRGRDLERIFAPLGRVDRTVAGHGLGLTLSKRLIERNGGSIGVESTVGEGSSFWFTLPATHRRP